MRAAGRTTPGIRMPWAILFVLSATVTARGQTTYYVNGACGSNSWAAWASPCSMAERMRVTSSMHIMLLERWTFRSVRWEVP